MVRLGGSVRRRTSDAGRSRRDDAHQGKTSLSPAPGPRGLTGSPCPGYNEVASARARDGDRAVHIGRERGPSPRGPSSDALPFGRYSHRLRLSPTRAGRRRRHPASRRSFRPGFHNRAQHSRRGGPAPLHGGDIDVDRQGHPRALRQQLNLSDYRKNHWEGTFDEYLDIVARAPRGHAHRLPAAVRHDPVARHRGGVREQGEDHPLQVLHRVRRPARRRHLRPRPAADAAGQRLQVGRQGLRHRAARAAAARPGRLSKSTIARLLKKGLEEYSRTDAGMLFTFAWKSDDGTWHKCPMHEEPLHLVPLELRPALLATAQRGPQARRRHEVAIQGDLCPFCRQMFNERLAKYDGDWHRMLDDVKVYRLILSEQDRIGIGTFQPKDEKNQDSTELTGDINYRKIAEYGTDSDPRAFNFDGELNIANRGLVEFIEVLKLDVAFLYDLLGASQEHKIKPKKFAQTDIDEVILGPHQRAGISPAAEQRVHGSPARPHGEDRRALRHPAQGRDQDLREGLQRRARQGQAHRPAHHRDRGHVGGADPAGAAQARQPDAAAEAQALQRQDAARLHRGQRHRAEARGGQRGHARHQPALHPGQDLQRPRRPPRRGQRQPVHGAARAGDGPAAPLAHHQPGAAAALPELLAVVKEEYEDIVKNEVQRAIAADEDALTRLCSNYIDNVKAYTQREKVRNRYTGNYEEPDERLMRSVEEKIDIPEGRKDDFRREIMNYIGALAIDGKKFDYKTNERLQKALELKLFEDQKDTIKLTSLVSNVVDKATQEKIDVVKSRLIRNYGYNESSATDVLTFVASIFARGHDEEVTEEPGCTRCTR